jgi:hypothetical protein
LAILAKIGTHIHVPQAVLKSIGISLNPSFPPNSRLCPDHAA